MARHTHPVTSALSIVGEVLLISAGLAAVIRRDAGLGAKIMSLGFGIAIVAHLFQPGTVRDEVAAVGRHPFWGLRAETERVSRLLRSRGA